MEWMFAFSGAPLPLLLPRFPLLGHPIVSLRPAQQRNRPPVGAGTVSPARGHRHSVVGVRSRAQRRRHGGHGHGVTEYRVTVSPEAGSGRRVNSTGARAGRGGVRLGRPGRGTPQVVPVTRLAASVIAEHDLDDVGPWRRRWQPTASVIAGHDADDDLGPWCGRGQPAVPSRPGATKITPRSWKDRRTEVPEDRKARTPATSGRGRRGIRPDLSASDLMAWRR